MTQPGHLVLVAGLCLFSGCGKKDAAPPAPPTNAPSASGNPLTAPVDYLGAVNQAHKNAIKTIDTAALSRQIDLFHEQEDRYPKDLNELVSQHYLNSLPKAPYGMKLQYNPATGQVRVVKE